MLAPSLTLCLWRGPSVLPAGELLALPLALQLQQQQELELSTGMVQMPASLSSSPRRDRYCAQTASLSASTLIVFLQLCDTVSAPSASVIGLLSFASMHSIAKFHSVDSANSQCHLSLMLPRPKQIAELVLLFCVLYGLLCLCCSVPLLCKQPCLQLHLSSWRP